MQRLARLEHRHTSVPGSAPLQAAHRQRTCHDRVRTALRRLRGRPPPSPHEQWRSPSDFPRCRSNAGGCADGHSDDGRTQARAASTAQPSPAHRGGAWRRDHQVGSRPSGGPARAATAAGAPPPSQVRVHAPPQRPAAFGSTILPPYHESCMQQLGLVAGPQLYIHDRLAWKTDACACVRDRCLRPARCYTPVGGCMAAQLALPVPHIIKFIVACCVGSCARQGQASCHAMANSPAGPEGMVLCAPRCSSGRRPVRCTW